MKKQADSEITPPERQASDDQASMFDEAAMTAWLGMTIAVQEINQYWAALLDSDEEESKKER